MDNSAFRNFPDFGLMIWWAMIGIGLTAILDIAGFIWPVVFLAHHLSWS